MFKLSTEPDIVLKLKTKNYQNMRVCIIENEPWTPVSGKLMSEAMGALKVITIIPSIVSVESTEKANTQESLMVMAESLRHREPRL